ncbi:MAG: methyltransferase domain-containing protein [Pseudomonadota bacterium]
MTRSKTPKTPAGQLERHEDSLQVNSRVFAARLEPFSSFWQGPEDVESGYSKFAAYYSHNYVPYLPSDRSARILVVSCGPGYLLSVLRDLGYTNVLGIDSDPEKLEYALRRGLDCQIADPFEFLEEGHPPFDLIVPEQELNHLTLDEMIDFLRLCRQRLAPEGQIMVYGLNGANPLVAGENLAHNIDHFNLFAEYSLTQILTLTGFDEVKVLPLRLYVFWRNPLNYVGVAAMFLIETMLRISFILYGKDVKILTKKLAAIATVAPSNRAK